MAKKSNKTSHVLSLLTNRASDSEEEITGEVAEGITEEVAEGITEEISPLPMASTPVPLEKPPTKPPVPTEELSEIIKAQLELITEKEEEEIASSVSSFNLEYFDEEEDSNMYHYANIVEDIVKVKVLDTMKEMCSCTCEKCVSDVIAHSLNNLPPKYVVTEKGNLFSKLAAYENQYSADVTAAIVQACLVINEHPRH